MHGSLSTGTNPLLCCLTIKNIAVKNWITFFLLVPFCSSGAGGDPVIFLHCYTDSWYSFEKVLMQLPLSVHAHMLSL